MIPDEEVRVIVLPQEYGWALTPVGEAALEAAQRTAEGEPTVLVARPLSVRAEMARDRSTARSWLELAHESAVAEEARDLARKRRSTEIAGDPPTLL